MQDIKIPKQGFMRIVKERVAALKNTRGLSKRGSLGLGDLPSVIITLAIVVIITVVVLILLSKFMDIEGLTPEVTTAINNSIGAIASIPNNWMEIIVLMVVVSVILGLVITAFAVYTMRQNR